MANDANQSYFSPGTKILCNPVDRAIVTNERQKQIGQHFCLRVILKQLALDEKWINQCIVGVHVGQEMRNGCENALLGYKNKFGTERVVGLEKRPQ